MDKILNAENKIKHEIIHDDINATEFLLTHFYEENFTSSTNKLKLYIKKLISWVAKQIPSERFYSNVLPKLKYKNKKYVYVQMFDIADSRHFSILDNLIQKTTNNENKQYTLIVTNSKRVAAYYKIKGFDVLSLKYPKFIGIKKSNSNLNFEENLLINKCIFLYEKAKKILVELDTEVIFTTQDFHIYDQIFTKAANKVGVISVTHQHGMIPYPTPGLFKYIYSTYVMVWGKSSYDTLKEYIPEQKIIISGTDKFNYLLTKPHDMTRRNITLALNPIDEKTNREIIYHTFKSFQDSLNDLEGISNVIVKLHPSLNRRHYEEIIQDIITSNDLNVNYIINENDNFMVLYSSKIFIGYLTTLSLEAMIAGCSVIELNMNINREALCGNRLFRNLPESIVHYNDIKNELLKRILNTKYNNDILMKQRKNIDYEIHDFSIKTELDYINDMIEGSR
ncbi:Uncharacterised protein [Aerococcus viridans]|uniref:Uncharacterized protein n=2 Tax=Aerococcus viridans TaxID=1377 RepID=A0AAU8U5F2_9LACT|nr:hypothetical protein [Aerococcus viridans]AMC01350.1 hypothetical protein AWM76_07185 [Aerococcus viridans]EFG50216.1 hypothetical protein HMPREF0061_0439 [Aerococcus viridans ATCC 11563 = CCUG 4311]SUU15903.1 Uncharacterised protein [Aerococcus viridans]